MGYNSLTQEEISQMTNLIKDANKVAGEVYTANTLEFVKANKEIIGLTIQVNELKKVNEKILETLEKINKNLENNNESLENNEEKPKTTRKTTSSSK